MLDSTKTILIVDDDPSLLFGIQALLKRNGYAVHTAPNGDAGLRYTARAHPDLIVCDIRMPGMNGLEVLQQLRRQADTADIPLVFLTASDERADVLKGFADGADDYIVKPFDPPELLARIQATLRRIDTIRQSATPSRDENPTRRVTPSPHGMLLVDQTGTIQFASRSVQAMLGTFELTGKSLFGIMPSAWQTVLHPYLTGAVQPPNEPIAFECELQRFTGEKFPAQVSAVFVRWEDNLEARITLRDMSEHMPTATRLDHAKLDLLKTYEATLLGWARALELRDGETKEHVLPVAAWMVKVARALGISEQEIIHLRREARLHALSELGIPNRLLVKPGMFTAHDRFTEIQARLPAQDLAKGQPEQGDATECPSGLQGEAILIAARISAVLEVWDALAAHHPYRPERNRLETSESIRQGAGEYIDPWIAEIALEVLASPIQHSSR